MSRISEPATLTVDISSPRQIFPSSFAPMEYQHSIGDASKAAKGMSVFRSPMSYKVSLLDTNGPYPSVVSQWPHLLEHIIDRNGLFAESESDLWQHCTDRCNGLIRSTAVEANGMSKNSGLAMIISGPFPGKHREEWAFSNIGARLSACRIAPINLQCPHLLQSNGR